MFDTKGGPRARRRAQTIAEIIDAAWALARAKGVAGISLRELGDAVGLGASSLYAYFDSKDALYDAMFAEANRQLIADMDRWEEQIVAESGPRARFTHRARAFADWCNADPARYQLLFQRTAGSWEPSPATYALAVDVIDRVTATLAEVGLGEPRHLDLWTALIGGVISQQLTNEPGGDRWIALIDDAVAMYFDHFGVPADRPRRS